MMAMACGKGLDVKKLLFGRLLGAKLEAKALPVKLNQFRQAVNLSRSFALQDASKDEKLVHNFVSW